MNEKKRILLIDDEEVTLFGYSKVLKEPGVELDCAKNLSEAERFISKNRYGAAVIDLRLSDSTKLEGFECVRRLKRMQESCRIIILTAYGDDVTWEKAEDLSVDMFLEKPLEPESIKKTLRTLGAYDY